MKILCVIDSLGSGGAQRQLVELAIGFKERGHDVSFLVYHEENFFKSLLDDSGIPLNAIIEPNYFNRLLKMRRLIRSGNYNAVLSFLEASNFICEIAGLPYRKWKLVVGERSANPDILKFFKLRFYRWFHIFSDFIVANSSANINLVRKINPMLQNSKFKVIYNMIDTKIWVPKSNFVYRKNGQFILLVVSSHQHIKNLNGLVEAINKLSNKEQEQLKIEWYGDIRDNSLNEALTKINKYNLIKSFQFYPATNNILVKIQESDAIGLFSFHEGLPNAVCEAMACGKPVICSSVSDNPLHICNEDLLFDPYNSDSITKTISFLLKLSNTELTKIGKRNRLYAINTFSKEKISNSYLELLL